MKRTKKVKADAAMLDILSVFYGLGVRGADITLHMGLNYQPKEKITSIVDRRRREKITSIV